MNSYGVTDLDSLHTADYTSLEWTFSDAPIEIAGDELTAWLRGI